MELSQESVIFIRCPIIFRGRKDGPLRNLTCYGFECGSGWFQLIYQLSVAIEDIAREIKNEGTSEDHLPLVVQVKEKFGGLRFYMDHISNDIDDLIENGCSMSLSICESCGAEGATRQNGGWIQTLCENCRGKN